MQATFPTGVCDWSKPAVDERPPLGAWLDYGALTRPVEGAAVLTYDLRARLTALSTKG